MNMLEYLPMSTATQEDLLKRFGKVDDPQIEARRQRILRLLLDTSPEVKEQLILEGRAEGRAEGREKGLEEGRLEATRAALRRVLASRRLIPSEQEDARIAACSDVAVLDRWLDRAGIASSVGEVLA